MGKVKYVAESFYCETCNKLEEKATCREFRQVRTEDKAVREGQGVDMTDEQARAYEYLERYYQAFIKAVGEGNTTEM